MFGSISNSAAWTNVRNRFLAGGSKRHAETLVSPRLIFVWQQESATYLDRIEDGTANFTLRVLFKIAPALGMTVSELLEGIE